MFALSLVDFLSLLLSPSTYFNIFYFCQKYHLNYTYKIFKKISCWFKIWMGFVRPILIKLWTSSIWGFLQLPLWRSPGNCLCKLAGDHSVTTEACSHLTSLVWVCVLWLPWKLNGAICAMTNSMTICPWWLCIYFQDIKAIYLPWRPFQFECTRAEFIANLREPRLDQALLQCTIVLHLNHN